MSRKALHLHVSLLFEFVLFFNFFETLPGWTARERHRKRSEKGEMRWCEIREQRYEMQTTGLGRSKHVKCEWIGPITQ